MAIRIDVVLVSDDGRKTVVLGSVPVPDPGLLAMTRVPLRDDREPCDECDGAGVVDVDDAENVARPCGTCSAAA